MNKWLSGVFKNETQRSTVEGALFGLLFPITASIIRLALSDKSFGLSNLINLHLSDPLMWIIDTAPFFLGLFASVAGRRQESLIKLNQELKQREIELGNTQITLEKRVAERTRELEQHTLELETISEIIGEISIIRDMETLLNLSVNLIRERFKYYHAGIFLVDEQGEYATLQAASSVAAPQLLEQKSRLKIRAFSRLGTALQAGRPYISLNVPKDMELTPHPLLPDTISELILPIRKNNITIGVLDIQIDHPATFDERYINTLQIFTDQLGTAIENSRLLQRVEGTVNELNMATRMQTQSAWRSTIQDRKSSFEYDGQHVRPIPENIPNELFRQLERGKAVIINENSGDPSIPPNTLLIPIMLVNQVIGVIGLEQDGPAHNWTDDEITIAEAAANRAALTLENTRLLEESQRRAYKERTISEASSRIGAALNIENILDITAEELERVLGNTEVILQIDTKARPSTTRMVSG